MRSKLVLFSIILLANLLIRVAYAQTDTGHFFTSFDRTKIYYEVKGNGFPVILIHGFIVNGESWKKTAVYKNLTDAGYKVITLDMRGNGKSDKPHTGEAY